MFTRPHRASLAVSVCVLALIGSFSPALAQDTFSLGLWSDMPYAKANDAAALPALVADMNASDIAFSMFGGDLKDGKSECVDAVYTDAIALFDSLKAPVIYVPGDNEWTDCHRTNNGGYDNLERLAHLRATMFAVPETFGQTKLVVEHQGLPGEKFAENTRFAQGGAVFVGLNVPGSNNNMVIDDAACSKKSARTPEQCAADNAEYAERDAANIAWLKAAFDKAKAERDKGVMIVVQGDLGFDLPETEDDSEARLPGLAGYANLLDALIAETTAFDGQVVLVHGDTHYFKVDKPLPDATHMLANFTRVQQFGSPNIHWIKVGVDATSREVFSFTPMIVAANATKSLGQ